MGEGKWNEFNNGWNNVRKKEKENFFEFVQAVKQFG